MERINAETKQSITSTLSTIFFSYLIYHSLNQEFPEAYHFALIIGCLGIIPSVFLLVQSIIRYRELSFDILPERKKHLLLVLFIVIAILLLEEIGFYVLGFLLFFSISLVFHMEKISLKLVFKTLGVSFIFMAVIYLLFAIFLNVQTPKGILF